MRFSVICFILFGAVIFVLTFLVQLYQIPDSSMNPSLEIYQYTIFKRYFHTTPAPSRGDIILYQMSDSDVEKMGRVIALPLERMILEGGKLYLDKRNFEELEESSLAAINTGQENLWRQWWEMREGEYLVLEDNSFGKVTDFKNSIIKRDQIKGIFWFDINLTKIIPVLPSS
ncbi:MAG: signal peptidase I [bacterium]|nr:signal peptidase I [bacterium]